MYTIRDKRNKDSIIHHDRLLLASDKVALPFWIHRQRKKVLFDVDESIRYERKRLKKLSSKHKPDDPERKVENNPLSSDNNAREATDKNECKSLETPCKNSTSVREDTEDVESNPETAVCNVDEIDDSFHLTWKPQYESYRSKAGRRVKPVDRLGI